MKLFTSLFLVSFSITSLLAICPGKEKRSECPGKDKRVECPHQGK